jgi:indolepyruvate ferredoxin oxidoreductase beta subunit
MDSAAKFDIYVIGVGGQGIGLLSEVILRAADHAGQIVRSVDTHGLAQRGGMVVSQIRMGPRAHSAIIPEGTADLVVALERHEALRALNSHAADGATLVYYDAVWQPQMVRLGREPTVQNETIAQECDLRGITCHRVQRDDLDDSRMQNVAVLAEIAKRCLVPGVERLDYEQALDDLLGGSMLEKNLSLFQATIEAP